jgi:hypothetical protein
MTSVTRTSAVRTFTDINDERVWAWGHVDPFPRRTLDLQAGMIRRLQQLLGVVCMSIPQVLLCCMDNDNKGR